MEKMLWILIGLSIISRVCGYSNGNFPQSCESMSVQHGKNIAPQTSSSPFEVISDKEGDPITVTLRSKSSAQFRGFMLEARNKGMMDKGPPVGKFILLEPHLTGLLTCNGVEGSAVSKTNNIRYSEMKVNWTAQGQNLDVDFIATFVQDYETFWERVIETISQTTTTKPSTTTSTTMSSTISTTTSTTKPSITISTKSTAKPSTIVSTTMLSTTTSATTNTTEQSTATSTTMNITKPSTAKPSTIESTTMLSTTTSATTNTTEQSTATSTTMNITKPSTAKPSTIVSTTMLSTTVSTTTSATKNTAKPSSTTSTTNIISSTTPPARGLRAAKAKIVAGMLIVLDKVIEAWTMELSNIVTTTLMDSPSSRHVVKTSNILFSLLCFATELVTLILLGMSNSFLVILVSLLCVVILISFIKLVIVSLPIGPSHELREIFDLAVKVFSVIVLILKNAIIFIIVLDIEHRRENKKKSWLLKVMIAYTVWTALHVIWVYVYTVNRNELLGRSKRGNSRKSKERMLPNRKKKLSAAEVITTAVSVIFMVGEMSFAASVFAGCILNF